MPTYKSLDEFALAHGHALASYPVTIGWNGTDYTGTTGSRDTVKELVSGGVSTGQELRVLVPVANFGSNAPPGERAQITLCVDGNGIPCSADDSGATRVNARVMQVGRAGAGLTFTLQTAQRG